MKNKVRIFGKWKVTNEGDLIYDNGIYVIDENRLKDEDWILHLMESKGWIDLNEFIPAYFYALEIKEIEYLKIRIFYNNTKISKTSKGDNLKNRKIT